MRMGRTRSPLEGRVRYKMAGFRRKNYFVNKRLQSGFVAGFSAVVFLGFLANLVLAYFLIDRELTQELYKIHIRIGTTSEIAVPILMKLSAVTVFTVLAVSGITGYFLTRRIELPLIELRDAVRGATGGDLTRRLSRKMTGELPAVFNTMFRSLEAVFGLVKKSGQALERESGRLEGPGLSVTELAGALEAVTEARRKISQEISKLKV